MSHPPSSGHASLPPRPPPATSGAGSTFRKSANDGPKPAFAGFAPRAVTSSAHYSAAPVTNYSAQPTYSASSYPSLPAQPTYDYQATPQIKNPFVPNSAGSTANPYGTYDPEAEAQLQQWQSAYAPRDDKPGVAAVRNPTATPSRTDTPTQASGQAKQLTVKREGGGTTWTDDSLLEWDPAHFRIFVGNLAGEVTDDSLLKAFGKYPSVQKARVVRDKRTTKSKGFGFVSFADGDDYFQAAREMQGKYIGSHPVQIKRAQSEVRPTTVNNHPKGKNNKHKGKGGPGGHNKVDHGGIQKAPKTKGGLKVLG